MAVTTKRYDWSTFSTQPLPNAAKQSKPAATPRAKPKSTSNKLLRSKTKKSKY